MTASFADGDTASRQKRDRTPTKQDPVPVRSEDDEGAQPKKVPNKVARTKLLRPTVYEPVEVEE